MKSKWKETQLGAICDITSSKRIFAKEYRTEGIPFYRGKEIIEKQKGNAISTELYIEHSRYDEILQKHGVPQSGDILLTSVGTLGIPYVVQPDEKFYFKDGNLTWFRNFNDTTDSNYIYYWLLSSYGRTQIDSKCIGSTQKALTIETLLKFNILLPSFLEQKAIVSTLSCLDEKIELNNKINDNLETQIVTFMMGMFSDSVQATKVRLGDYLYIKGRIGWKGLKKSEYLVTSKYRIINGESLTKAGIAWNKTGYISEERYLESPEIMLQVGDILLSKDGTIGKIGYVDELMLSSTVASGIFVIRNIKKDIISTPFIYYLLKSHLFKEFIASRTEGSVIPHLYQKDFMDFQFSLPNEETMHKFDKIANPMFEKIMYNLRENDKLSLIRDTLLPKLMSGEIEVPIV